MTPGKIDRFRAGDVVALLWAVAAMALSDYAYTEYLDRGVFMRVFAYLVFLLPVFPIYAWRWVAGRQDMPKAVTGGVTIFGLMVAVILFRCVYRLDMGIFALAATAMFLIVKSCVYGYADIKAAVMFSCWFVKEKRVILGKVLGVGLCLLFAYAGILKIEDYQRQQELEKKYAAYAAIQANREAVAKPAPAPVQVSNEYTDEQIESALDFDKVFDGFKEEQTEAQEKAYNQGMTHKIFKNRGTVKNVTEPVWNYRTSSTPPLYSVTLSLTRTRMVDNRYGGGKIPVTVDGAIVFGLNREDALSLSKGQAIGVVGKIQNISNGYADKRINLYDAQIQE